MINGMAHFVGEGLISKIKEDIIYFFVYSTSIWLEFSYTYICVEVQLTHFISVTGSMDMYLINKKDHYLYTVNLYCKSDRKPFDLTQIFYTDSSQ